MDLERNIKKIEELISDDKIGLAIQALRDLLGDDQEEYFRSDSDSLISMESRYNRNERGYSLDGTIGLEEYQLELNKIKKGLFSVRNNIQENADKLGFQTTTKPVQVQEFFKSSETITDKASKIVLLFLMAAAAILLIYFIAFHKDEETQITGILASGGVVVVSLFKQTLDKYIRLRFS